MLREVESPSKVAAAKSRPHQAPKSKESDAERPVILTQTLVHKDAISNAIDYAKFYSRSHDPVIRVYDEAGNVIEAHEQAGEFKEP
jgi:hypothetical protein